MKDVAALVGLDIGAMDYMEKYHRLPKVKTAITVAAFLGIPASWVLTGKGENPFQARRNGTNVLSMKENGFHDSSDSTVVQGNNAGTMIINHTQPQISEQKKELIRIFDALSVREQTRLLNFAYEIEEARHA